MLWQGHSGSRHHHGIRRAGGTFPGVVHSADGEADGRAHGQAFGGASVRANSPTGKNRRFNQRRWKLRLQWRFNSSGRTGTSYNFAWPVIAPG